MNYVAFCWATSRLYSVWNEMNRFMLNQILLLCIVLNNIRNLFNHSLIELDTLLKLVYRLYVAKLMGYHQLIKDKVL